MVFELIIEDLRAWKTAWCIVDFWAPTPRVCYPPPFLYFLVVFEAVHAVQTSYCFCINRRRSAISAVCLLQCCTIPISILMKCGLWPFDDLELAASPARLQWVLYNLLWVTGDDNHGLWKSHATNTKVRKSAMSQTCRYRSGNKQQRLKYNVVASTRVWRPIQTENSLNWPLNTSSIQDSVLFTWSCPLLELTWGFASGSRRYRAIKCSQAWCNRGGLTQDIHARDDI
jgi:hypothetical protein